MDFFEWRDLGMEKGWISEPFCNTHNGDPFMSEEEEKEWEEGGDPCLVVFKIFEDNINTEIQSH
jgi:hypothetical protein